MSEHNETKKYEPFKIPDQKSREANEAVQISFEENEEAPISLDDNSFYVIDYDTTNIPGVGKFKLKPQKIQPPERDEIRELFYAMRDIARVNRTLYFGNNHFYNQRAKQENAYIFYKQGMFMKDFTDSYGESISFKEYFPYYQMMSYEQLRTYFTWRTEVRKGNIEETSLSYAFLYLYELIHNIGVDDPEDGLIKLMAFWTAFKEYDNTIDKYVLRWLKDYHIYYPLPHTFKEFIFEYNLEKHYPKMADTNDFGFFCALSKYDIQNSAFFTGDKVKLTMNCFYFVKQKLEQVLVENNIQFDESIFQPKKKMSAWRPFKDALFFSWMKQLDRRIVLSENEIYICSQNSWSFNTAIISEGGRQFIGYMMKQIEAVLRAVTKYKYKLTANINTVNHELVAQLKGSGISLEKVISEAVLEFYREETKTVVSVDDSRLSKIRQEALATQEKLIVEEPVELSPLNHLPTVHQDKPPSIESVEETSVASSPWGNLKGALNPTELEALSVVLIGETTIKKFADDNGIMVEVLVDGINEKAMDFVGDNLLDEEFILYDDYLNQVKEMVG